MARLWEIRESYGEKRMSPEVKEAYECGYEEGYADAKEEMETMGGRMGRRMGESMGERYGYGERAGGGHMNDPIMDRASGYGERRGRDSMGRFR